MATATTSKRLLPWDVPEKDAMLMILQLAKVKFNDPENIKQAVEKHLFLYHPSLRRVHWNGVEQVILFFFNGSRAEAGTARSYRVCLCPDSKSVSLFPDGHKVMNPYLGAAR